VLGSETATAALVHTPAERQRCNRPISPLRRAPRPDGAKGVEINTKETGNYARKRLIDMINAEINTLTPDSCSSQFCLLF